jgi:hypothetical protein
MPSLSHDPDALSLDEIRAHFRGRRLKPDVSVIVSFSLNAHGDDGLQVEATVGRGSGTATLRPDMSLDDVDDAVADAIQEARMDNGPALALTHPLAVAFACN